MSFKEEKKVRIGKYFSIRSKLKPDVVLEIKDGVDKPGVAIVTNEVAEGQLCADHQLWFWDRSSSTIRSKLNSFCIDSKDDCLMAYPFVKSLASQKWVFSDDKIQTGEDFEYVITVREDCLQIDAQCHIAADKGLNGQRWKVVYSPAQYFYIRSSDNQKVLDVRGADPKPGAKVLVYPDKGDMADNQLWYEDQEGVIHSKLNGFVLDGSGKDIMMLPHDLENSNQQWVINGCLIQNRLFPQQILEMKPAKMFSDATVVISDYCNTNQLQFWTFEYVSDSSQSLNHRGNGKHFLIRSRSCGLVLEVKDKAATVGSPIVTGFRGKVGTHSERQLFYIDEMSGTLRTELNGFCVDVDEDMLVLGPYDCYSKTQQWRINGKKIHNRHQLELVMTLHAVESKSKAGLGVALHPDDGSDEQHWDIIHLPARCFYIVSQLNDKVLDVKGDDVSPGAKVIMYERKAQLAPNQLWYEDERGIIRSKLTGFVLDSSTDHIRMRPFDPSNGKHYWMVVGDRIQNKFDNRIVLDIEGENKKNSASLIAYKFTGGTNQRWKLQYV